MWLLYKQREYKLIPTQYTCVIVLIHQQSHSVLSVPARVFITGRPGNGHFTFPNFREWSGLVPGENGNDAADGIAVI